MEILANIISIWLIIIPIIAGLIVMTNKLVRWVIRSIRQEL